MIVIDGSHGVGGGQILRTALSLSVLLRLSFKITNIRLGRDKPGLRPQHSAAVKAAKDLCDASVEGNEVGSTELIFMPRRIAKNKLTIDIGTAGSITLLLQSILLPCVFAEKKTSIFLIGGTDTMMSQPIDYLKHVLMPHLKKYAEITVKLMKRGYFPKGGGEVEILIVPKGTREDIPERQPINLVSRGELAQIRGIVHASVNLHEAEVAERIADAAKRHLKDAGCPVTIKTEYTKTESDGAGITLWAIYTNRDGEIDDNNPVILGADALGERGMPSEEVGRKAAMSLRSAMESLAPVDIYLADQLLPFMALDDRSVMLTPEISDHCRTNMTTIEHFLPIKFVVVDKKISLSKLS